MDTRSVAQLLEQIPVSIVDGNMILVFRLCLFPQKNGTSCVNGKLNNYK